MNAAEERQQRADEIARESAERAQGIDGTNPVVGFLVIADADTLTVLDQFCLMRDGRAIRKGHR